MHQPLTANDPLLPWAAARRLTSPRAETLVTGHQVLLGNR